MPWRTILAVAGLLLSAQAASACSCSRLSRADAIARMNVVFKGAVRGVRVSSDGDRQLATVEVTERIKGRVPATIVVTTSTVSSACGYPLQAGKTYSFRGAYR